MSTTVEVLVEAVRDAGTPFVVVSPCGESVGFPTAAAELQTSVREKLPIIVVVSVGQETGLIRVKQEIKGLPAHGFHTGGVDWEKLAAGFGADGVAVGTEKALGDALSEAFRSGRTTLIAARIDPSGHVAQFNALREL